jgi:hypothetical protein
MCDMRKQEVESSGVGAEHGSAGLQSQIYRRLRQEHPNFKAFLYYKGEPGQLRLSLRVVGGKEDKQG